MGALFLQAPSFGGFDGGAGSRRAFCVAGVRRYGVNSSMTGAPA